MKDRFVNEATVEGSRKYEQAVARVDSIYRKKGDIRSEFFRDYTRLLHSTAYRRLKHKTQVFFATHNDHICTRIEHVNHVSSVSYTISKHLGLNTELTSAIATGHDIGHAPFGHEGENILKKIMENENLDIFWHERNSLFFADNIETLPDPMGEVRNLDLTYAVRDGIICHCGEITEDHLIPREEKTDLTEITAPNQYAPFTWEGCVVKISDNIAFLGRDIEDAITLDFLEKEDIRQLREELKTRIGFSAPTVNNTGLIHTFILDLCEHSDPAGGLRFSGKILELMQYIKKFNYERIYFNKKLDMFKQYARLVITSIYNVLLNEHEQIIKNRGISGEVRSPLLRKSFNGWLNKYFFQPGDRYTNRKLFSIENRKNFIKGIIIFISGMTDNYAIAVFNELNTF